MIKPAWKSPISAFVLLVAVVFSAWLTLSLMAGAGHRVAAAGMGRPIGRVDPNEPSQMRVNIEPGQGTQITIAQLPPATPILLNQPQFGEITPTLDTDYYVFTGDQGSEYEVRLSEDPPDTVYSLKLTVCEPTEQDQLLCGDESTTPASGEVSIEFSVDFDNTDPTYYFRVRATADSAVPAPYQVEVTLRGTTPQPEDWDDCEINDTLDGTWNGTDAEPPGGPKPIAVGVLVSDLNFVPYPSEGVDTNVNNPDFFTVWVKAGLKYSLETTVTGVDTEAFLYEPGVTDVDNYWKSNDDASGLGQGSRIEWTPPTDGNYGIRIINRNPIPPEKQNTYNLIVRDVTPTATPSQTPGGPTSTPTRVPIPGTPDAFEPNWDFEVASLIGLGVKYTNLNFVPYSGTGTDNDFYKLWVTGGKLYTCETLDLGDATNTNMILYSCPSFDCGFAGNDDVQPFDPNDPYRSKITFFSSYTGYLYVLLGQVGVEQILPGEWANLSYSLQCYIELPGTATPTPTSAFVPPPPQPTSTPAAQTPVPLPPPTRVVIIVVPMTTPEPPAPAPPLVTPTPQLYVINVVVYFDRNGNGLVDPGEGIRDVLTRAYDAITDDLLSIDYTDEIGRIQFTIPSRRPVRVSVPFFGFEQIVTTTDANLQIRISPVR